MYSDNYSNKTNNLFSYANGYCGVFPKGLESHFKAGDASLIIEDDYIVVIKNGTPDDIKNRFLKDYAEYHRKKETEQLAGNYND